MMSIKRKKRSALASLAFLAALLLTTCQMGMEEEFLPLPPAVPYASLVEVNDAVKYVLDWRRADGILRHDGVYEPVSIELLEDALEKFNFYTRTIDPKPFYDQSGSGMGPDPRTGSTATFYEVGQTDGAGGWLLDNSDPPANGPIVLHRYWPTNIPDVAAWLDPGFVESRKAAFKKAAGEIESMMAAIKASPLYTTVGVDTYTGLENQPLVALYEAMEEIISYNPPLENCGQRTEISWDDVGSGRAVADLPPDETGPLYEYYLGAAPGRTGYVNQTGSDQYALPGTP